MEALKCVLFFLTVANWCESANILYVVPFTSKSHYIMLKPIGLELARRGHNVTVITGHRDPNPPPNYRQVMVDEKEIWDVIGGRPNVFDMAQTSTEEFHYNILWKGGLAFMEVVLDSKEVKAFLAEDNKFDLVINEQFYQESLNVLAHKYNAPLALVTTFGNCMRHNILVRNPLQLSTVISEFLPLEDPTSFYGRLRNLYFTVYEYIYWRYWYMNEQERFVKKYIKGLPEPVPSLYDLQRNASLMLMNSHFSFDTPAAYLPNVVEIGGSHLIRSNTTLPADLQKVLDNAKNGAVYLNFGSNVRSAEMPEDKKNAIINVFRKLKHTVLWKWEDDHFKNKPDNLIIRKWMPQKEILAHPNVKVFISHGGLIGTQEATYNGVPLIGIPIYGDQFNNLLQAQSFGYAKILQYNDINEENLYKLLHEVLTNDSYAKNAKEMSRRFQDRPMSPLDTAMYWIEYVIRNNGAHYWKNPALELSWIAAYMIDVYLFIFGVTLLFLYVVAKVVSIVLSAFSGKKTKKQKTKRS
ncbi:UDP-glucuronosyltransferase 2B31-like [Trichoplusia ni]|uniref:UDP-glucuronosyltransferase 2B31-like n=1 Tax=Trichoplusia ni TaxID=7111 RepID=A0A7E5W285_TRINI|nr:UDP-glucuronosyltransferase 2B31-like [Trichoplusia ni]